jgi:ribosomal protein L11 methyltransferase
MWSCAVEVATAGGADAELAADALWQAGAVAIEERGRAGGVVLVAATGDGEPAPLVDAVSGHWPAEVVPVDGGAALDAWRPYARPVVAGPFLVRPPWIPSVDAPGVEWRWEVILDPGRAFGSGAHASTRLALQALGALLAAADPADRADRADLAGGDAGVGRVLDVGCGSGVLAIAALGAGAASAVGVDIDPEALAAAQANAARNAVGARLTVSDRLPDPTDGGFDLVVANMLAPTLVELGPAIRARLRPGHLVLSGLLSSQRAAVLDAYPGLSVAAEEESDGWIALVLR